MPVYMIILCAPDNIYVEGRKLDLWGYLLGTLTHIIFNFLSCYRFCHALFLLSMIIPFIVYSAFEQAFM